MSVTTPSLCEEQWEGFCSDLSRYHVHNRNNVHSSLNTALQLLHLHNFLGADLSPIGVCAPQLPKPSKRLSVVINPCTDLFNNAVPLHLLYLLSYEVHHCPVNKKKRLTCCLSPPRLLWSSRLKAAPPNRWLRSHVWTLLSNEWRQPGTPSRCPVHLSICPPVQTAS